METTTKKQLFVQFSGWKKILFGMEAKAEITDEV